MADVYEMGGAAAAKAAASMARAMAKGVAAGVWQNKRNDSMAKMTGNGIA